MSQYSTYSIFFNHVLITVFLFVATLDKSIYNSASLTLTSLSLLLSSDLEWLWCIECLPFTGYINEGFM